MINGPLTGVIVLDLTRVLAGPYCTGLLYKLGARVIKVENPKGGDESRTFPPFVEGESAYSCALNHGKESIALDIKGSAEDRTIFEKLVQRADVLIENFRPDVLDRLGYTLEKLSELNPRLITARISGFGKTGPDAFRACYDLVAQGMSGLMAITGEPGQQRPIKAGIEISDMAGGIFAAIGICASLFNRTRTGRGDHLGASLLDSTVSLMNSTIIRYSVDPSLVKPTGARHSSIAPFDVFFTKDKKITICVANDHIFLSLCRALGHPEMAEDERFITNKDRIQHVEPLEALINQILVTKTAKEWLALFNEHGVPAGPINNIGEVLEEPQIQYRNMIAHFSENYLSNVRFAGNPIKYLDYPDTNEYPRGPKLNEHRQAIIDWLESEDSSNS